VAPRVEVPRLTTGDGWFVALKIVGAVAAALLLLHEPSHRRDVGVSPHGHCLAPEAPRVGQTTLQILEEPYQREWEVRLRRERARRAAEKGGILELMRSLGGHGCGGVFGHWAPPPSGYLEPPQL
jgi:hypothetical protein